MELDLTNKMARIWVHLATGIEISETRVYPNGNCVRDVRILQSDGTAVEITVFGCGEDDVPVTDNVERVNV